MKAPQNVSGDRTQHRSSQPFFGGPAQNEAPSFFKPLIQAKLTVNTPGDQYEQEADHMADQLLAVENTPATVQRKCADCTREDEVMRREEEDGAIAMPDKLGPYLSNTKGGGAELPEATRGAMEQFFNADLSRVRVHTGGEAVQMSRDLQARAFTHGNDIYFNEGQYVPDSKSGKHLLAHELTHTIQQNGSKPPAVQRYTEDERRRMAEFKEQGQANDVEMATKRGFDPGDIVFRSGSSALGLLTGLPVTHGGIYIGKGLIHDVVSFGNRYVRVTNFFNKAEGEATDPDIFRLIRFKGPLSTLIIPRLLSNIARLDFRMPTDPVPFNLFSSSDDYGTATCLEYAHAQFLYAIRQLSADPATSAEDLATLRATYFTGTAAEPDNLIKPQGQALAGNMITGSGPTFGGTGSAMPSRSLSATVQEAALIAAATGLAKDTDPTKFSNRSESKYKVVWPGGPGVAGDLLNFFMGFSHDVVTLNTFTYKSFADSRKFFKEMTVPSIMGPAAPAAQGR